MTALVGVSGSRKATIGKLIAVFWNVNKGEILIGEENIKNYTLNNLVSNISVVFQNVYLFEDTVANKIKFGSPNATHEEVVAAWKLNTNN